jgi:hypothetical protein
VSHFCAEIQLSVKIWENIAKFLFHQKTHGARRRDGEGLGARLTMRGDAPGECGNRQSLCVVNDQPVGNPKRKV